MRHRSVFLTLAIVLGLVASGCATVAPYEREAFTRSDMQLSGASEDGAQTAHVMEIREGAAGGFGASGGGCGCN